MYYHVSIFILFEILKKKKKKHKEISSIVD